ncbi:Coenzyme F420 hydrogenase/dehydrogenase, beta subunit C-terminal domain [Mangrovibacterium diazotrophicum]|uniref:Coenzyme F420-reducing hydrogenase beta subunit n=1 Tax=Mangrovibacterium diazotrophicum TaxID=1261403 RepID=A0A419W938_9BACT|nr:Coenzyme F420 hydrogenase/dehydrogenase, beta subunit C-terminal domain [Mangrovibacterium diazotrophicum]RKD91981.1 coenzyme F420-reducing hydrogenase beta subunit [Mangrovibacterium diazotrophicum]
MNISSTPSFLNTLKKEECYGCMACVNACGTDSISITRDSEGFIYPAVDKNKCILCGKCAKVCPLVNEPPELQEGQEVYYAWSNNTQNRLDSSSGGIFSEIATTVLSNNGLVYGAAYANDMSVVHIKITTKEELPKIRGSKYIQSDISPTFKTIKADLKAGKLVYFTGTPCQVSAIKKFTNNPDNLITSDLVCHGVPSSKMFQDQLSLFDQKINNISFRDKKRTGWGYDLRLVSDNKTWRMEPLALPYFYGFWKNLTLRPSCYNCQFATINREGDITLADYWLVRKSHPSIKTGKGVSAIIVNTDKGCKIIEDLNNITVEKSSMVNLLKGLGRLKSPVKKPQSRDLIMLEYSQKGFSYIAKNYLMPPRQVILKEKALRGLKQLILFKYWK